MILYSTPILVNCFAYDGTYSSALLPLGDVIFFRVPVPRVRRTTPNNTSVTAQQWLGKWNFAWETLSVALEDKLRVQHRACLQARELTNHY